MVNIKRLTDQAKNLVEKRGGTDALKQDAEQLKNIARGPGSISEKAKKAASALKEPGARDEAKDRDPVGTTNPAVDDPANPPQTKAAQPGAQAEKPAPQTANRPDSANKPGTGTGEPGSGTGSGSAGAEAPKPQQSEPTGG